MNKTTTTTQDPWSKSAPYLEGTMKEADTLLKSDAGFKPYGDGNDTFVPRDAATQEGLLQQINLARSSRGLGEDAFANAQGMINSGGLTGAQQAANSTLTGINSGTKGITTSPQLQGLLAQMGGPGAIEQYLSSTASGDYLNFAPYPGNGMGSGTGGGTGMARPDGSSSAGGGNPFFNTVLDDQSERLANDINRGFSLSGRYGSGAHTGVLGEQVGNFRNQAMQDQFNAERQLQMQAAGMIGGEQQARMGQQAGLLGQIGGVQGQNLANQMAANQQINQNEFGGTNVAGQYTAMAPQIYEGLYGGANKLMGVGAANEQKAGERLQSELDFYNQNQQQDWQRLAAANAIFSGAGQLGGTQSTVANAGLGGILGSLLGLFGLG